eukprot:Gb_35204 [translate_table: standard]
MVQGAFYGGLKSSHCQMIPSTNNKQEGSLGQGVNLSGVGVGFGFKEEGFSPMVQVMNRSSQSAVMTSGANSQPSSGLGKNFHSPVKLEVEEAFGDERPPSYKRPKFMVHQQPQWSSVTSTLVPQCLSFNPLEEPSPLGLTLKKTPSFLDLIQMKLSQGDLAYSGTVNNLNEETGKKRDAKCAAAQASTDKLKASNFPASFLRIGPWERISRYEGDLVAKCYYAKRKLVWEVLEGGLKSKIEIQWSDITSLKASYPDNEPGSLEIEISRPPLFFRETNPQPRKHTLWQATSDFTGGQASICRRHFLQFPQGILERHYEKLIQCDHRLNLLSKKVVISEDSPYFDSSSGVLQDQDEQSCYGTVHEHKSHMLPQFEHLKDDYMPPFSNLSDTGASVVSAVVPKLEPVDLEGRILEVAPQETPSPSSVMDSVAIEDSGTSDNDELHMKDNAQWEQLRFSTPFTGLRDQGSSLLLSKSMNTLVNQIGSCFSEPKFSCDSLPIHEEPWSSNRKILDDIAQHLLSDSLLSVTSDEQTVIARVNSMCSLIQKDNSAVHASQVNTESFENSETDYGLGNYGEVDNVNDAGEGKNDTRAVVLRRGDDGYMHCCKPPTGIPREESVGDLLVNLPRIASFPQFLVNVSDNEQPGTVGRNQFR